MSTSSSFVAKAYFRFTVNGESSALSAACSLAQSWKALPFLTCFLMQDFMAYMRPVV